MGVQQIGIALEATADASGVQQMNSAIADFSGRGAVALEKMKQSSLALQQNMISLRKELGDGRQAQKDLEAAIRAAGVATADQATRLAALEARNKSLASSVQSAQFSYRTATQEIKNWNASQRDALGEMQMLAAGFGVQIPAAIGTMLTKLGPVQSIIASAIPVAGVVGAAAAVGVALGQLVVHWDQVSDAIENFGAKSKQFGLSSALVDVIPGFESYLRMMDARTEEMYKADLQARKRQVGLSQGLQSDSFLRDSQLTPLEGVARLQKERDFALNPIVNPEDPNYAPPSAKLKGAISASYAAKIAKLADQVDERAQGLVDQAALVGQSEIDGFFTQADQQIQTLKRRASHGSGYTQKEIDAINQRAQNQANLVLRNWDRRASSSQSDANISGLTGIDQAYAQAAKAVDDTWQSAIDAGLNSDATGHLREDALKVEASIWQGAKNKANQITKAIEEEIKKAQQQTVIDQAHGGDKIWTQAIYDVSNKADELTEKLGDPDRAAPYVAAYRSSRFQKAQQDELQLYKSHQDASLSEIEPH